MALRDSLLIPAVFCPLSQSDVYPERTTETANDSGNVALKFSIPRSKARSLSKGKQRGQDTDYAYCNPAQKILWVNNRTHTHQYPSRRSDSVSHYVGSKDWCGEVVIRESTPTWSVCAHDKQGEGCRMIYSGPGVGGAGGWGRMRPWRLWSWWAGSVLSFVSIPSCHFCHFYVSIPALQCPSIRANAQQGGRRSDQYFMRAAWPDGLYWRRWRQRRGIKRQNKKAEETNKGQLLQGFSSDASQRPKHTPNNLMDYGKVKKKKEI